jgi:hypothetical protein
MTQPYVEGQVSLAPVSLVHSVTGMLWRPRATFEAVVASPRWAPLLVALALVATLGGSLSYATDVGRLALVDQWERTALAFGRPVDDAAYERLHQLSARGPAYGGALSLFSIAAATFGTAGLAYLTVREPRSQGSAKGPSFQHLLAVSTHSAVILALRSIVAAPLVYLRETTTSATALGRLFPSLNEASPVARVLGGVDVLLLWWAVVLAMGLAVACRRRARPLVLSCVGLYVAVVLVLAGVMAATGGTI